MSMSDNSPFNPNRANGNVENNGAQSIDGAQPQAPRLRVHNETQTSYQNLVTPDFTLNDTHDVA